MCEMWAEHQMRLIYSVAEKKYLKSNNFIAKKSLESNIKKKN